MQEFWLSDHFVFFVCSDYLAKVVVCGDSGVGKTCLLKRFVKGEFESNSLTTIGVDFEVTTLQIAGAVVKLQIWDTAGQERFRTVTSSYFRGASAIALTFDITNEQTFKNIQFWMEEIEHKTTAELPKMLVGNKSDLASQRQVTEKDAQEFAAKHGMTYIETSAKNATNLDELFKQVAEKSIARSRPAQLDYSNLNVQPDQGRIVGSNWFNFGNLCTIL
jgi:Ras-related protein Rab-1A